MASELVADTLTNLVAGLGNQKDKGAYGQFSNRWLGRAEIDAMYYGDWIAGTLVDAPCDDMTREWREWKAGPRQTQAIEAEERRLQLKPKVNQALKLARKDGGSVILIGTGDADPSLPLDLAKVRKSGLQYLHVLSRYQITPNALNRDPASPHFGEPESYQLTAGGTGRVVTIHPSRVVRFLGTAPLDVDLSVSGWGYSILERVYDAVRNTAAVTGNLAALTYEAKVDVFKVKGLTTNAIRPDWRERILARFSLANTAKSINNALLLDDEETWEQKAIGFGGFPELIRQYIEIAAGAGQMPVTRLLGTTPGGMSNNNDGALRHYYDTLSSRQEIEVRPNLGRLDDVLIRSAIGANPEGIWYEFKPLWQLTEAELADVAYKKAQTTEIYATLGVMSKDALREASRSQISEDGIYPGFDGIMERRSNEAAEPLIAKSTIRPATTKTPTTAVARLAGAEVAVADAQDAAPRTLYVSREVENAAEILAWARAQGIPGLMDASELHVTVAYSKAPVDWFAVGTAEDKIVVPRGGPRQLERFDQGALVLLFSDWSLSWRWDALREAGCSWDHGGYQPHVTLTYGATGFDLTGVEPYQGRIVLGPENFAEIDDTQP